MTQNTVRLFLALIGFFLLMVTVANAEEATLPITVRIIQCVTQQERIDMCEKEMMCCDLIEPAAGEDDE